MASGAGHPQASFEAVLSSLGRHGDADSEAGRIPFAPTFGLPDGERTLGFAAMAELAFEDIGPEKPPPSDAPDVIASELALAGIADPERLRALRRRFMWDNHPDRRPDLPRDLADRRVAIANMLIDRALRKNWPGGGRGPRG